LLENALHAAAGGDAPASVVLAVDAEDSGLRFCVRDSGRGMTPVVAARLFEPFFTTRADGTGLGLAIARGVARAHGGDIEVASTIGTGAELIFTLPPASVMPGTEEIGTT
jgi:two-component system sensor histidine kinase FlrB